MYFKSRTEAGIVLAGKITPKYIDQRNAVIALSDGGVIVATQIALKLRCVMMLLLTEGISLPREPSEIGAVTQDGDFSYNSDLSSGEIDEYESEFRTYIDEEKMQKTHKINSMLGMERLIRKPLLKNHNVILVSDGLSSGSPLEAAASFLKPIVYKKLIIATPLASVQAVDRMHLLGDDIYCLSVPADYMNTDHYYEINDVPNHTVVLNTVETILKNWPN
jgi:putative phosphoribosyl transferase